MDRLSPIERSRVMSRIRGKNTKPELIVRRLAHGMGYRFRLHGTELPGKPDVVLPKYRKVIFVHGCFWHRHSCRRGRSMPSTRLATWTAKFDANKMRDIRARRQLRRRGWQVLVVWECQTRPAKQPQLVKRLCTFLSSS